MFNNDKLHNHSKEISIQQVIIQMFIHIKEHTISMQIRIHADDYHAIK